jgi:hypothetical protein
MTSPYTNAQTDKQQLEVTQKLLDSHPLKSEDIRSLMLAAWDDIWKTFIGKGSSAIPLKNLDPPATIIGYLLEKVFAKKLSVQYPQIWRGGANGSEKDLLCLSDNQFSVEMKASGQMGIKIFGNRSYGQKLEENAKSKKDKSGYYITVNFHGQTINLIRFGWIDTDDWIAQRAASGQMSSLKPEVYLNKLIPIKGDYVLNAPIELLNGLGPKSVTTLKNLGYHVVRDLLEKNPSSQTTSLFNTARLAATNYAQKFV